MTQDENFRLYMSQPEPDDKAVVQIRCDRDNHIHYVTLGDVEKVKDLIMMLSNIYKTATNEIQPIHESNSPEGV